MGKFQLDEDLIRGLADLLHETGLDEIEYEAEGRRIRVGRNTAMVMQTPAMMPAAGQAEPSAAAGEEPPPAGTVTSPMVGTVYLAAEPGATPFVKVGDTVREGQTLMIIEAMKVMNPLPSPRAGKVTRVFVRDGQPVEFGEPLVIVE